jgi:thiol:disulfide interchange protein DsbA
MKKVLLAVAITGLITGCNSSDSNENTSSAEPETTRDTVTTVNAGVQLQEGVHYETLETPIASQDDEIIEFIWYQCGHCYSVEQVLMNKYKDFVDEGVILRKEHALISSNWLNDGRLFYGLRALNKEKEASTMIFDFYHNDNTEWTIPEILAEVDITENELMAAMDSDEVKAMMERSTQDALTAKISGTPTFIVEGKYKVLTTNVRTYEELLDVALELTNIDENNE